MMYVAMKAGEQIGLAARPADKEEIRSMLGEDLPRVDGNLVAVSVGQNRELR